jgi:hypothetical protein
MRRPLVAAVLATAVLTVASGAEAKAPPAGFRLCGVSACVSLGGNDAETVAVSLFYGAGVKFVGPTAVPSDFYALRWQFPNQREESGYYVGGSRVVRLFGAALGGSTSFDAAVSWLRPSPGALQVLSRLSGAIQPMPVPTVTRVTVGGRAVRDPASYVRLWAVGVPALPLHPRGWLRVRITTATPSPWSDSLTDVRVARSGGWLYRDGTFYRVPAKFAARIRARQSLST